MNNVRVKMFRENLQDVPEFQIPEGFSLRWYKPGDENSWVKIQLEADGYNAITPEWFEWEFGSDGRTLQQRQCYLQRDGGEVIGTGTAWFDPDFEGGSAGRVHWLAVAPEYQRRGLGKALLTQLCHRLSEMGHQKTYLLTSTARIPAIKLYSRFGFQPLIRTREDEKTWHELEETLHTVTA